MILLSNRYLLIGGIFMSLCIAISCSNEDSKIIVPPPSEGALLSEQFCSTCHIRPEPAELDKETWRNHILVRMGAFLGVYWVSAGNNTFFDTIPKEWVEPGEGGRRIFEAGIYPPQPKISRKDWLKIVEYYVGKAPEKASAYSPQIPLADSCQQFSVRKLFSGTEYASALTALRFDPAGKQLFAAFYKQELVAISESGSRRSIAGKANAVVQIDFGPAHFTITDIGSMAGTDLPLGKVRVAASPADYARGKYVFVLDSLQRPVHTNFADLDADGDEDAVICEFGRYLGALSWYENTGVQTHVRHELFHDDGPTVTHILDMNGDKLPDIVALMANADEGIDLFQNQGKGQFLRRRLLRFSPTYGCTGLDVRDMNGDGREDLVLCNGDNMDYSPILKRNHGIRIFLQEKSLEFKETVFLPLNGAYGIEVRDFDLDGDPDIAAVSFFPDFNSRPGEAFVFFRNTGKLEFEACTIPEAKLSRWMLIDAGDVDADGDQDIVLGAFNVKIADAGENRLKEWIANDVPILLLENQAIK